MEPRTVLWAVAEVLWEDAGGASRRAPATMEDTSLSGACVRVKQPFNIGSRLTIKWCREQFSGVAKNCRKDGKDFLLGVRREPVESLSLPDRKVAQPKTPPAKEKPRIETSDSPAPQPQSTAGIPADAASPKRYFSGPLQNTARTPEARRKANPVVPAVESSRVPAQGRSLDRERKVMASNNLFSRFWHRPPDEAGVPENKTSLEVPVNKSNASSAEGLTGPHSDLLSYDDIYHAAGIMSPRSGYSIHKVVDMLNNERIRDLSKEAKRASVLMALDAAGASADEVLQDAMQRQQALNAYEAGQRKQVEDFEARKTQENAQIEVEVERLRAHYAERIQRNHDQVKKEKETLHNWQMAMQHESQRISEVIELCGKQPAAASSATLPATKSAEKAPMANARGAS